MDQKVLVVLYLNRSKRIKITPQMYGGHQEMGFRSGTTNVPLIVGLTTAIEIAVSNIDTNNVYMANLRNHFESEILKIENTSINGSIECRVSNVSNILF